MDKGSPNALLHRVPYLKAWAMYLVASVVGGGLVGVVAGAIIRAIAGVAHFDPRTVLAIGIIVTAIASLTLSFLIFRFLVRRLIADTFASATPAKRLSDAA